MLLGLILMCKNSGPFVVECLSSYLSVVDFITIYDTGSTDDTVEHIKKLFKKKKFKNHIIVEESFIDFSTSRNNSIEIAEKNSNCDYQLIIDDTYVLKRPQFLRQQIKTMLSQNIERSAVIIKSPHDDYYKSCRIIKSHSGLRYKGLIHEYIDGDTYHCLANCYLDDIATEENKVRTKDRLLRDLELLEQDTVISERRRSYYKGITYMALGQNEEASREFIKRITFEEHPEERFMAYNYLALFSIKNGREEKAINWYFKAIETYPPRAGECFFMVYLLTGESYFLIQAKQNPLGLNNLPCPKHIYDKLIDEEIINVQNDLTI